MFRPAKKNRPRVVSQRDLPVPAQFTAVKNARPPGMFPLRLAAEVALQRAHLEVAPQVGLDSLRRSDGS